MAKVRYGAFGNSNAVSRSAEVGLDPRVPCRQGVWQGISDFLALFGVSGRQFVLRFQCLARQFPATAGNFLRRGREFTYQGREFAISVNPRLKIRRSTVDSAGAAARSRTTWRTLPLVPSCAPIEPAADRPDVCSPCRIQAEGLSIRGHGASQDTGREAPGMSLDRCRKRGDMVAWQALWKGRPHPEESPCR
jgi:hypothetical protein